jgi:putative spermidine/putrescine transport system permease protein
VTGIALQTSFVTFGIDFGLLTIVVGHATFCVVIAYNNVIARLRRLPRHAGGGVCGPRRRPVHELPADHPAGMGTALLSGALLAFALSFDEIIVTNFTAAPGTQTLPMWILSAIQRRPSCPSSTWSRSLMLVSVIPVYIATRISGESAVK